MRHFYQNDGGEKQAMIQSTTVSISALVWHGQLKKKKSLKKCDIPY